MAITLIGVSILMLAKALPEKTVLVTSKPLLVLGKLHAPVTMPAPSRTATAGAMALPFILWANTTTVAFIFFAAAATRVACTFTSKKFKASFFN